MREPLQAKEDMKRVRGTRRLTALTLGAALALAVLTGCATSHRVRGADKAGGSDAPLVLRLGDVDAEDDPITTPVLEYFGDQVAKLSGGTLRVRVIYDAAGHERPDVEAQVARKVRDGRFDLGWIGAAAWDELGVMSFQALHAPFLVTDDALLDRVATGPLAGTMLAGLRRAGIQGLAVIPESLRNPVGLRHPLVSLGSFRGARLVVTPSRATDAALRALGATPVHGLGKAHDFAIADGLLESLVAYLGPYVVTGNASIFPVLHTLFANPASLRALTDAERAALQQAAARTLAHAVAKRRSAQAAIDRFCSTGRSASATGGGRVVLASRADIRALVRATRPVYSELERDPRTKRLISQIRALKRSLPSAPAIRVPGGCSVSPERGPTGSTAPHATTRLDGTYRWLLTKEDAMRVEGNPDDPTIGSVSTMTLRAGKWQNGEGPDAIKGTYKVTGNRIAFNWPSENSVLVFTFTRDHDGTLHLRPAPSVEQGDRFVWSSEPWRRIGPPVRDIP
jgi:TRAP-type C4-dicarboxylate transport system substrate-binding protein